jgi:hypothetical protein
MSQKHIIKKQVLDITLTSNEGSFTLQSEISRIYHSEILPILDEYFSALDSSDEPLRIERLEIDAGEINPRNIRHELVKNLAAQLPEKMGEILHRKQLYDAYHEADGQKQPKRNKEFEIVSYYLTHGRLPWWVRSGEYYSLPELLRVLLVAEPKKMQQLLAGVANNPNSVKRLVYQASDELLESSIALFQRERSNIMLRIMKNITATLEQSTLPGIANRSRLKKEIWQSMLSIALSSQAIDNQTLVERMVKDIAAIYNMKKEQLYDYLVQHIHKPAYDLKEKFAGGKPETSLNKLYMKLYSLINEIHSSKDSDTLLPSTLRNILSILQRNQAAQQTISTDELETATRAIKELLKTAHVLEDKERRSLLHDLLQTMEKIITEKNAPGSAQAPQALKHSTSTFTDSDEIYIQNAGIVIFWPYLQSFFSSLELTSNNSFMDEKKQEKAVTILHYLASGSLHYSEHEVTLNKILCGIDLETALELDTVLTTEEIEESENLLRAVLRNWAILKNTTPEGLQTMFLRREGQLSVRDGNWLLRVERKTHDILLERMPWTISTIKLPWMERLLLVEWNT